MAERIWTRPPDAASQVLIRVPEHQFAVVGDGGQALAVRREGNRAGFLRAMPTENLGIARRVQVPAPDLSIDPRKNQGFTVGSEGHRMQRVEWPQVESKLPSTSRQLDNVASSGRISSRTDRPV
jgi:hypothetical protein